MKTVSERATFRSPLDGRLKPSATYGRFQPSATLGRTVPWQLFSENWSEADNQISRKGEQNVHESMDPKVRSAIYQAVEKEPLAQTFGMALIKLDLGYSMVKMHYDPNRMANIYQRAHGGAIYSLIDEAFETASQTHGTIAVALNVNVAYVSSPDTEMLLFAEAREVSRTRKIAHYDIKVNDEGDQLLATCQATAYRTGKPIPFL
mgnify:CR=1 FL=1